MRWKKYCLKKRLYKTVQIVVMGFLAGGLFGLRRAQAVLVIDDADPAFKSLVVHEVSAMREGKRGVVCEALVSRIEASSATTTIRPVTKDETTWHPNDRR